MVKRLQVDGFSKPEESHDDEHSGGFVLPLLLLLLGSAAASAVSGAVEGGLRKKVGLNNNIIGTGLVVGYALPFCAPPGQPITTICTAPSC